MGKWTIADIPSQSGRTAVITGTNSGVGFATASALAGRGASYFPARSSRTPRRWPEDCAGVASSGRPASRKRPVS